MSAECIGNWESDRLIFDKCHAALLDGTGEVRLKRVPAEGMYMLQFFVGNKEEIRSIGSQFSTEFSLKHLFDRNQN